MMILYSVSVTIDSSAHDEWLSWMKEKHIKDVMQTEMFSSYRMYRVLFPQAENGTQYIIEYACSSMKEYDRYQAKFAPALQAEHQAKYKGKFTASRTILENVAP